MFHRVIFFFLIVSSLYCNFNRCAVCFQSFSVNIAFTSTQTATRIKRFWRLHIDEINKKTNIINSLLCWSETLSMFIQTDDHSSWAAKVRTGWPYRKYINGLAKSPGVLRSSWILNECYLYCKIAKYCILSEVCMIKTVPHSTVSPQMWCKNGKKVGFRSHRFVGKIL